MAYNDMKVLAVIPARGGSKSIPRKNLCRISGLSLVGRAVRTALELPWIDTVILSTDDQEIASEGLAHGAEVPFLRPDSLAGDLATSVDMWKHAWTESEAHYGVRYDVSILLEPTSPLRRPGDIERTVEALLEGDHLAAATISPAPAHFTPHKCLTVDGKGCVGFYLKDGTRFSIRQNIPESYYFRNGVCYAVKRETLLERSVILEEKCAAVILDRPLVNIDEPFDLELAEFLLEREAKRSKGGDERDG
jgi:CMP-N-acetylneuraminic acid synthetase